MNRTEKRKTKLRKAIVDRTMKLIRENGYENTSMEQIARETDIAKATLYNYFPAKEAIIEAYIQMKAVRENPDTLNKIRSLSSTRARCAFVLEKQLSGVKKNRVLFEKYLICQMRKMVSLTSEKQDASGMKVPVNEIIELGVQSREIRADLSRDLIAELFMFVFIQCVKSIFLNGTGPSDSEVIDRNLDLFMNGVKKER